MKTSREILNVLIYFFAFVAIQVGLSIISGLIAVHTDINITYSTLLVLTSIIGSALTMLLFLWRRWTPFSQSFIQARRWGIMIWVVLLALGTILPLQWLYEQLQIQLPIAYQELFKSIIGNRYGYLAIGILAPLVEEMVFRGAILRSLLRFYNGQIHWVPIIASAALFGLTHLNWAQGIHAFIIGLILGWLYYRSNSIVPGIIFHWVNNTIAYALYNMFPQMDDGKLIDFFRGDAMMMYGGIGFSLLIFLPALLQLYIRLKR